MKIEHVFVASDLSDASEEAIRLGHRWAEVHQATLTVGFVVPSLVRSNPFFPQAAETDTFNVIEAERRASQYLADRVLELTGRGPDDCRISVTNGTPVAGILEAARRAKADLVVVGPDADDDAATAERIARLAPCAVLIARKAGTTGAIVAGTDLSDPSLGAVRAALDIAKAEGGKEAAKVTIVHVVETPPAAIEKIWSFLGQRMPTVENKVPAARARIHAWLTESARDAPAAETAEVVIVEGDAATALLGFAASRGAELIVIGTRGWTREADLPLGTVAEVVVRTAPSSVLVVRL